MARRNKYLIRQLSIFSENRPGKLSTIAKALKDEDINIFAFSIAEGAGYGVIRMIVDQPERAYDKLTKIGFVIKYTDVIAAQMDDHPGGLYEVTNILAEASINIEYSYAYSGKKCATLIMRVEDPDKAVKRIVDKGGKLLEASLFK